ncbi:MAG: hypothetical protein CFH19_00007 [Alphaproteobacteria bacterium MarineAlpha5_Bin9]|nr:MAG: hypothetical protein CFH19_00007 [Alphaproteobacteria bacterium MarineAlpha5_Bin9]|tara:strand:- start:7236 stop:7658 length:423 start_codon:yes stop_codon:yes gene_type:complete
MILSCPACNSRYLVNSAELKPNGRMVHCSVCKEQWFQEPNKFNDEVLKPSILEENNSLEKSTNSNFSSNLPSKYVLEEKPKIFNSIIAVLFISILILLFWFLRNTDVGTINLILFFLNEFYFNLKLILNDLAGLIYKIIN